MAGRGDGRRVRRRSAFESFDEGTWITDVRERLRSALLHRDDVSREEHGVMGTPQPRTDAEEIPQDPKAKAHMQLTAEAMQEMLALGGVMDEEKNAPVVIDKFAEQVWRVDQPPKEEARPSSLFSAFRSGEGVDIDAMLRFRMGEQEESPSQVQKEKRPLIEDISAFPDEDDEDDDEDEDEDEEESGEEEESEEELDEEEEEEEDEEEEDEEEEDEEEEEEEEEEEDEEEKDGHNDYKRRVNDPDAADDLFEDQGEEQEGPSEDEPKDEDSSSFPPLAFPNAMQSRWLPSVHNLVRQPSRGQEDSPIVVLSDSDDEHPPQRPSMLRSHGLYGPDEEEDDEEEDEEEDEEGDEEDEEGRDEEHYAHPPSMLRFHGQYQRDDDEDDEVEEDEFEEDEVEEDETEEDEVEKDEVEEDEIDEDEVEEDEIEKDQVDDDKIKSHDDEKVELKDDNVQDVQLANFESGQDQVNFEEERANDQVQVQEQSVADNEDNKETIHDDHVYPPADSKTLQEQEPAADELEEMVEDVQDFVQDAPKAHSEMDELGQVQDAYEHDQGEEPEQSITTRDVKKHDTAQPVLDIQIQDHVEEDYLEDDHVEEEHVDEDPLEEAADDEYIDEGYQVVEESDSARQAASLPNGNDAAHSTEAASAHDPVQEHMEDRSEDHDRIPIEMPLDEHARSVSSAIDYADTFTRELVAEMGLGAKHVQEHESGADVSTSGAIADHAWPSFDAIERAPAPSAMLLSDDERPPVSMQSILQEELGALSGDELDKLPMPTEVVLDRAPVEQRDDEEAEHASGTQLDNQTPDKVGEVEATNTEVDEDDHDEQELEAPADDSQSDAPNPDQADDANVDQDTVEEAPQPSDHAETDVQTDTDHIPPATRKVPSDDEAAVEAALDNNHGAHHADTGHITRSHCAFQRLTLLNETGAPTFIVRSCAMNPEVLAEEGAESTELFTESLEMLPLDADALPEPVYHALCRIVGPSLLDDVYVMPSSLGAQWMEEDEEEEEGEEQADEAKEAKGDDDDEQEDQAEDRADNEQEAETKGTQHGAAEAVPETAPSATVDDEADEQDLKEAEQMLLGPAQEAPSSDLEPDTSSEAHRIVRQTYGRRHRRPRKSDSSSGAADYLPPDTPPKRRTDPAEVSIEELEALSDRQPKRARADVAPRRRRSARERQRTKRPGAVRLYSQAKLPSMDFIRAQQREEEARIQEAEQAVADLGFPAPAIYRQKLTWGDHDQFRHVNNVHYIRWFENARFAFFELMANNLPRQMYDDVVQGRNLGVIQATNYCRYRRPALYPDTILVGQAVQMPIVKSDRFTIKTVAYSVAQRAVVAEGLQDLVSYDYNKLRKADMPPELREEVELWAYTGR